MEDIINTIFHVDLVDITKASDTSNDHTFILAGLKTYVTNVLKLLRNMKMSPFIHSLMIVPSENCESHLNETILFSNNTSKSLPVSFFRDKDSRSTFQEHVHHFAKEIHQKMLKSFGKNC